MYFHIRFVTCLACVATLTFLISGCEGDVSGGEQDIFVDEVQISGATFRVSSAMGSDSADGIAQPFATLQHALDQLRPGDRLIIEQGTTYSSTDRIGEEVDGRELQGFILNNSGAPGAPITIEGEIAQGSAARPAIDQQQTGSNIGNPAVLGLYLDCVSHIIIRNLEIRNANEAGISSTINGGCESTDILIEKNYIHSIHGEKYVGGIRLMGVSDTLIRDNQIENIFSNTAIQDRTLLSNGRGAQNILIENNQFSSLSVGVLVNAQGLGDSSITGNQAELVSGLQLAHNRFSNNVDQAISLQTHILGDAVIGKLQTGQFTDIDVYGNIFEQVDSAFVADLDDDEYQSESFCLFNNTMVESGSSMVGSETAIIDIAGVMKLQIYNNIIVMPQGDVLVTRAPLSAMRTNSLDYSDYNLFRNSDTLNWHLDVGGPNDTPYIDLASWQNANAHPDLSDPLVNPDSAVFPADPEFVDQLNGDYSLSLTSPALLAGRFGMSMGADYQLPAFAESIANDCIQRIQ